MEGGPKVTSLSWLPLLFLAPDFLLYFNRETKIHHTIELCIRLFKIPVIEIRVLNGIASVGAISGTY